MPRPANGYRNSAGDQVPGVTDITGRFKQASGLIHWAYSQGRAGVPLYGSETELGTIVHAIIEQDLAGHTHEEIRDYAECALRGRSIAEVNAARNCFRAYRSWTKKHAIEVIAQETSLVSEAHQYGGTPDLIARVDGTLALVDFKTSKNARLYPEMVIAMAGHAALWNEHNPDRQISTCHLVLLAKDGSGLQTHSYADVQTEWQIFCLWLQAWRLEQGVPPPAPKAARNKYDQPRGPWLVWSK